MDSKYRFTNICVGWPGSVHDAWVFANSSLYKKASAGNVLTGDSIIVNGIEVSPFLIGDSAYPLLTWLVKPFGESRNLTQQQKCFNFRLSRVRIVVKNAFG